MKKKNFTWPHTKIRPKDVIIMQLVADGLRLQQIAEKMGLSERTIEGRISN